MKLVGCIKLALLFFIGGLIYFAIEIIYKGESHFSMFLVGGLCFLLIHGQNRYLRYNLPLIYHMLTSALIITALEFVSGCIVNIWLRLEVWDYSALPFNLFGQVCLRFSAAWFMLSLFAVMLDDFLCWKMFEEEKPQYSLIPQVQGKLMKKRT